MAANQQASSTGKTTDSGATGAATTVRIDSLPKCRKRYKPGIGKQNGSCVDGLRLRGTVSK